MSLNRPGDEPNPIDLWNNSDEETKRRRASIMVKKLKEQFRAAKAELPQLAHTTFEQWFSELPGLNQPGWEEVKRYVTEALNRE